MPDLYIEIDSHLVYPQALRAAQRHSLELYVVTKDYLAADANLHLIAIEDDHANGGAWIVSNIGRGDICITADPHLAAGCIQRGALALSPSGRQWGADAAGDDARGAAERWSVDTRLFVQRLENGIAVARAM